MPATYKKNVLLSQSTVSALSGLSGQAVNLKWNGTDFDLQADSGGSTPTLYTGLTYADLTNRIANKTLVPVQGLHLKE